MPTRTRIGLQAAQPAPRWQRQRPRERWERRRRTRRLACRPRRRDVRRTSPVGVAGARPAPPRRRPGRAHAAGVLKPSVRLSAAGVAGFFDDVAAEGPASALLAKAELELAHPAEARVAADEVQTTTVLRPAPRPGWSRRDREPYRPGTCSGPRTDAWRVRAPRGSARDSRAPASPPVRTAGCRASRAGRRETRRRLPARAAGAADAPRPSPRRTRAGRPPTQAA